MVEKNNPCTLVKSPREVVVILTKKINIYHSKKLKGILLEALDSDLSIRIDMSDVTELDLTILQLLFAAKTSAKEKNLPFKIEPISPSTKSFFDFCAMTHDLLENND